MRDWGERAPVVPGCSLREFGDASAHMGRQWEKEPPRQRDLFPLPTSGLSGVEAGVSSRSRSSRRREARIHHVDAWARDVVTSLNELAGLGESEVPAVATAGQEEAIDHIRASILRIGQPPEGLTGAGAVAELRATHGYSGEPATVVPLEIDRLTLPPDGFVPIDLARAGPVGRL